MRNTYIWTVIPSGMPTVLKNCPKCGTRSEFECSGNFRVNANRNSIDVWLIYQCKKCNTTWNLTILSRVPSGSIEKDLYHKYLQNDRKLAARYAFDPDIHRKNKSILNYDNISYEIIGDSVFSQRNQETAQIELVCEFSFELRLDKLLSRQLCLSREAIKRLEKDNMITVNGMDDIRKAMVKNGMVLTIKNIW